MDLGGGSGSFAFENLVEDLVNAIHNAAAVS
jgi:hypothetical protein